MSCGCADDPPGTSRGAPWLLGAPDGKVRLLRATVTGFGVPSGAVVWVTGTAVDAHLAAGWLKAV